MLVLFSVCGCSNVYAVNEKVQDVRKYEAKPRIFYIATKKDRGSDRNNGSSINKPFATFSYAFTQMAGGDTLYIMNGTYNQKITGIPSGYPGKYTRIYALNDHQVSIDGQGILPSSGWGGLLEVYGKSYIEIRGLKVYNSSYSNSVCGISNSNNIILRVMGCWQAGTYKHDSPIQIDSSSDLLLEDVWAFGRGRYTAILSSYATRVTFRRVVTRWDDGVYSGEPIAGIANYKGNNNVIENSITFDHMSHPDSFTAGHQGIQVNSWNPDRPASTDNRLYGNISLTLQPNVIGFLLESSTGAPATGNRYKDNVSANNGHGFVLTGSGTADTVIENSTLINNSRHGLQHGGSVTSTILKNTLSMNNAEYGFRDNGGDITASYTGVFNNGSGGYSGMTCTTGCRTDDPRLLFMTRIEEGSSYKSAGEGGADIGANVVNRYIDGTMTDQALWPWPYENWIKEDMCSSANLTMIGRTGANTPPWCNTSKTFTEYIWEHIGNPIPF